MAKAIFLNDSGLYRICTDSDWTTFQTLISLPAYQVIDINDDNFNAIKWGTKHADSYTDTTINYMTGEAEEYADETAFKEAISLFRTSLVKYQKTQNTWKASEVQNTITALDAIDTAAITYPVNEYFYKWLDDNSVTNISTLQLV